MAGRASIVGAAATHVGKVRDHNEDAHFLDVDLGMFLVCDGMGGHAAGEVASALAIGAIRKEWASSALSGVAEAWLEAGTPESKKKLIDALRAGVVTAHEVILAEAGRDASKSGMGTTLVGAMMVGGELVFAHAGDSRAYLVRDGISMQLTEDHTLLARLIAAGIDVDVSGEGSRFRSMLTNALGIGDEVKVSTFVVPLADGDRFLLCSDGVSEYVRENEIGDVLTKSPSPARGAQKLIDLALERGGGDNATAVVVRVLEAGETPLPAEQRKKDDAAIGACALWGKKVTPQQRLRALRIAIPRDHAAGDKLPPHALGDRVAWIIVDGELVQDGLALGPGALVYPEGLLAARETVPLPDRDAYAVTRSDVRALAIRADDFRELCDDDGELGEALLESLAGILRKRRPEPRGKEAIDPRGATDPHLRPVPRGEAHDDHDEYEAYNATDPSAPTVETLERAAGPSGPGVDDGKKSKHPESAKIAPVAPKAAAKPAAQAPTRPTPPPPALDKNRQTAPTRPSPLPSQLTARPSPLPRQLTPASQPPPPSQPLARPSPLPTALTPAVRPASAPPVTTPRAHAETRPHAPVTDGAGGVKGFAKPLTPPSAAPTQPLRPTHAKDRRVRPPTDPEIETYLELEAELPGEDDPELASELSHALGGDGKRARQITIEDDVRTIESETDDGSQITVTMDPDEPPPHRPITAEDGAAVSGTISIPEDDPALRRPARQRSEPRED